MILTAQARRNPTMQEMAGLPDDQMLNPYWFDTTTGVVIQTEKHHGRDFALHPELIGVTHDEVDQLPYDRINDRFRWTIAYTNLMFARGWVRIDFTTENAFAVMAGGLDWADMAIERAAKMVEGPVDRLTAFVIVSNKPGTTSDSFQTFRLCGDEAAFAIRHGLSRWAKPTLHRKDWSETTHRQVQDAPPSKIRSGSSSDLSALPPEVLAMIEQVRAREAPDEPRCPFGFGGGQ